MRLNYVDGLRGIAACGVAWFHLYMNDWAMITREWLPKEFNLVSAWGRFGVQLFFALSGFVLAYTLVESRRVRVASDVYRYMIRRSIRLDLVYWVVLGLCLIIPKIMYDAGFKVSPDPKPLNGTDILGNILYFFPFISPNREIPVVWTLILEVQLYLVFSTLLWVAELIHNRSGANIRSVQAWLVCLLSLVGAMWPMGICSYVDGWLWPHLYNFMLGVAACYTVTRYPYWRMVVIVIVIPVLIGAFLNRSSYTAAALISYAFLVFPSWCRPVDRVLSSWVSRLLGRWSYCIYLLHLLVGAVVITPLYSASEFTPITGLAIIVFGMLVTFVGAQFMWVVVERPSINLSKKIILSGDDRPQS